MSSSICWENAATCSIPAAMPSMWAFISSTAAPRPTNASRASSTTREPFSVAPSRPRRRATARCVSSWISLISLAMWPAALCDPSASLRTSSATTAKPRPGLAGAGGLDRGVERQQVGLLGDAGDRRDDAGDLGRALAERCGSCRSPRARSRGPTAWPRRPRGRPGRRAGRPRVLRGRRRRSAARPVTAEPVVAAMLSASCLEDSTRRAWRSAPAVASPIAPAISPTARPASSEALAISREASETEVAELETSSIIVGQRRRARRCRHRPTSRAVRGPPRRRRRPSPNSSRELTLTGCGLRRDLLREVADGQRLEAAGEVGAVVLAERAQAV